MKKPNQDDEPFFITEEIAAEMIAGGYEFELPPIPCTIRLRDVLERALLQIVGGDKLIIPFC
ncbi:hypothetical protein U9Z37_26135 [Escherichia coli]